MITKKTKSCKKPYKFELEVNSERRIGIMNVRDTLPHGDRYIYLLYANVKAKRSYYADMKPR